MRRRMKMTRTRQVLALAVLALVSGSVATALRPTIAGAEEDFSRDIRPLLSDHCFRCHGPDAGQRKAELRLDRKDSLFGERDEQALIVPGDKESSLLWQRINSEDPDERMPPPDSPLPLSAAQIKRIGQWIDAGAPWREHWAFSRLQRPELPNIDNPDWSRQPWDRFVLRRLRQAGLEPSPPAERTALLRRVTLDLTGLPPTRGDVERFLADRSPDAYEQVVDRLLASPRYGERMAMHWLDAARFADTSGYQTDGVRHMWRWRDWVIDAYNRNLPYDRFTIDQLAGDLLPNPSLDQQIATGFNRNHRANSEGGIVFEEYLLEYAVDRVETTFTVWLGLTMGCARCHDHKYDPLTQEEFYQSISFFNRLDERGRVAKYGNSAPLIQAPTRLQVQQQTQLRRERQAILKRLEQLRPDAQAAQRAWEQELQDQPRRDWSVTDDLAVHLPLDDFPKLAVSKPADDAESSKPRESATEPDDPSPKQSDTRPPAGIRFEPARVGKGAVLDGRSGLPAGAVVSFEAHQPFSFGFWFRPSGEDGTLVSWMDDQDSRDKGLSLDWENGHLLLQYGPRWLDDAMRLKTQKPLATGKWQHLMLVYDGSQLGKGVSLYIDGKPQSLDIELDMFTGTFPIEYPLYLGSRLEERQYRGELDEFKFYRRDLADWEVAVEACTDSLQTIAAIEPKRRSDLQRTKLNRWFLANESPAATREAYRQLGELQLRRRELNARIPTSMVMRDSEEARPTFLLLRGQYDQPDRQVSTATPACLPPMDKRLPTNRLGLAKWLVSDDHPLTARVAANRIWQLHFGSGLVRTAEDFGVQGQRPTHPQLLDWLACELKRSGWDIKQLQRQIVTSATYRQSSNLTPRLLQRDPENHLLSRSTRLRLPAEMIRDQALAASGLLVERLGGPSVKPYQPAGLWKEIASDTYEQDGGAKLYRRSMYTFWKRTVPPPTMMTFDASSRETCTVQRARTNTPLQALALLNEASFVEASRGLAIAMLRSGDKDAQRIDEGYFALLSRPPTAQERQIMLRSVARNRKRFQAHPQAARELLGVGESTAPEDLDTAELAAYTLVANTLLNLDEAIVRD